MENMRNPSHVLMIESINVTVFNKRLKKRQGKRGG
jgi:hypothetical protein